MEPGEDRRNGSPERRSSPSPAWTSTAARPAAAPPSHGSQNRYKSVVCDEEVYALELVRYIHLNPLRARVVATLEELSAFPYSGHAALLGTVERRWQAVEEVLARLDRDRARARERYEAYVAAGASQGRRPDLVGGGLRRSAGEGWGVRRRRRKAGEEESVYDARVLGDAEFVRAVLSEAQWERREVLRKATQATDLSELGALVAQGAGITVEELCSGSRRPAVVAARRALAQVAIGELGRTGSAVARYLGVAASTANRSVTGALDPLARRLLQRVTECGVQ
jgi:putative transposase